jgi:hypothetical protein
MAGLGINRGYLQAMQTGPLASGLKQFAQGAGVMLGADGTSSKESFGCCRRSLQVASAAQLAQYLSSASSRKQESISLTFLTSDLAIEATPFCLLLNVSLRTVYTS